MDFFFFSLNKYFLKCTMRIKHMVKSPAPYPQEDPASPTHLPTHLHFPYTHTQKKKKPTATAKNESQMLLPKILTPNLCWEQKKTEA